MRPISTLTSSPLIYFREYEPPAQSNWVVKGARNKHLNHCHNVIFHTTRHFKVIISVTLNLCYSIALICIYYERGEEMNYSVLITIKDAKKILKCVNSIYPPEFYVKRETPSYRVL